MGGQRTDAENVDTGPGDGMIVFDRRAADRDGAYGHPFPVDDRQAGRNGA